MRIAMTRLTGLVLVIASTVHAQTGHQANAPERLDACRELASKANLKGEARSTFINECSTAAVMPALPVPATAKRNPIDLLRPVDIPGGGVRFDVQGMDMVRQGDVLLTFNNLTVSNAQSLFAMVEALRPDVEAPMLIRRGSEEIKMGFTIEVGGGVSLSRTTTTTSAAPPKVFALSYLSANGSDGPGGVRLTEVDSNMLAVGDVVETYNNLRVSGVRSLQEMMDATAFNVRIPITLRRGPDTVTIWFFRESGSKFTLSTK